MSIATYSGLMTELLRLIDGEDVSGSEIPSQTLAQLIHMGEMRIYREARTRYNETAWTGTTTSNLYTFPTDFVASSVIHFGKYPLIPIAENELLERLYVDPGASDCVYYCQAGTGFKFAPAVEDGVTPSGRYYKKLADLSEDTFSANTFVAAAEDLFLYAALSVSAPFFGQDARIPMWEAQYSRILQSVNQLDHRAAYASGRGRRAVNSSMTP